MNKLAKRSKDDKDKKNETEFKTEWRSTITVTLQKCNAKVIVDKLARIARITHQDVMYSVQF